MKVGEVEDLERLESLELPDHATISMVLPDGRQKPVPGIANGGSRPRLFRNPGLSRDHCVDLR